jgi:hypothetical protein
MATTTVWRLQQSSSHSKNPAQVLEGVCAKGQAAVAMPLLDMLRRNNMPLQEEELVALVILCGHPQHEHYMGMVLSEMRQVSPVFLPPSLRPSVSPLPPALPPSPPLYLSLSLGMSPIFSLYPSLRVCERVLIHRIISLCV